MFKIMIVDNDPTSLAIGRALLETEYQLVLTRSGHQALGALKIDTLPDLILLDMFLPGIDGMEFLKILKADQQYTSIPVIVLSNESYIGKKAECYHVGAADFIEKPINPDILKFKVQQHLAFLEMARENRRFKRGINMVCRQLDRLLSPDL